MRDHLIPLLQSLVRKHAARYSHIADALHLLHVHDNGGFGKEGERARRLLLNARRVSTDPQREIEVLRTDQANALAKLGKPLSEALGHLITIELAEKRISDLEAVASDRLTHQSELIAEGAYRDQRPLLDELYRWGVSRGDFNALSDVEYGAIARYIGRKVEQATGRLPPLRNDRETRGPDGRRHSFWNPHFAPWSRK